MVTREEKARRKALWKEADPAAKEKEMAGKISSILKKLDSVKHHSPEVQERIKETEMGKVAEEFGKSLAKVAEEFGKAAKKKEASAEEEKEAAKKKEEEEERHIEREIELEKRKKALVEEQIAAEKEKVKREKAEKASEAIRYAVIMFIVALLGFFFNQFVFGWQPAPSVIMSAIMFVIFLKVLGKRYAMILIVIDVASLAIIELLPAWGIVGVLILVRMFMWLGVGLVVFVIRWYTAKKRPLLANILMIAVIVLIVFYSLPSMNRIYTSEVLAHEEKYEEAYKLAAGAADVVVKQTNESVSYFGRLGRALPYLFKGDIATYDRIMNPPPTETDVSEREDRTIKEYTKVEFVKPDGFPNEVQIAFPQPIPIQLNAESPQKTIKIDLTCKFKWLGNESKGEVKPKNSYFIQEPEQITLTCSLPGGFRRHGEHQVIFEAHIDGVETESRLKRLFVGGNLSKRRKDELIRLHSLSSNEPSKSADEFASFSFGVGTPFTNPLLGREEEQPILGSIVNKADGTITNIKRISVLLPEDIGIESAGCGDFKLYGDELVFENEERLMQIDLSKIVKGKTVPLLGCFLTIPEELRNTEVAKERSFKSLLEYSYKVETKQSFDVKPRLNLTG